MSGMWQGLYLGMPTKKLCVMTRANYVIKYVSTCKIVFHGSEGLCEQLKSRKISSLIFNNFSQLDYVY